MSQQITLSRRATFIRKSGILYPQNPDDKIATSTLQSVFQFTGTTTNATQAEIYLGGVSGTRFALVANTAYAFFVRVLARKSDGSVFHATIEGTIKMGAAAANTAFVDSSSDVVITTIAGSSNGWSVTVEADTTNGALVLKVTGASSSTIHWAADLDYVKVS
jgi:hypothetical protein